MNSTTELINSLVEQFGLSHTVKQAIVNIVNLDKKELLIDFSRYCELEWNASEIPESVIEEYLNK